MRKSFALFLVFSLFTFASNAQGNFNLVGTAATLGNDCYRLTSNTISQNGSIWNTQSINLNQPFDFSFSVNLGSNNAGADGMTFVLQPQSSATGTGGGGIGAQGISPSVIVELDTYTNGQYNDLNSDHIGILSDGNMNHFGATSLAAPIQASATNANIEDGQDHDFRVTWDPTTQDFEVYFDCVLRLSYTGDIVNQIFGGSPSVYWGFTASTGGASNLQTVCIQSIATTSSFSTVQLCPGDSIQISASVNDPTASYSWSPTTNISNPTSATPVVSPTTNTLYIADITTPCLQRFDTVEVEMISQYDASFSLQDSFCIYSLAADAVTTNPSGTFSGTGITPNGTFDPQLAGPGTYNITYSIPGNCANSLSKVITVIDTPTAEFTLPEEICINDTVTLSAVTPGGIWSGQSVNSQTGFYNPSLTGPGSYQVKYTVNNYCINTDSAIIRHITPFQASAPPAQALCEGDTLQLNGSVNALNTNSNYPPIYNWSGTGITSGNNPATFVANLSAGVYTVTVSAATSNGTCGSSDSVDVTVYAAADTDFDVEDAYCSSISSNLPIIPNTPGIGTWAVNPLAPTTGTFNPNQFIPASIGVGTWEITYTITDSQSSNGCGNSSTDTVVIVDAPPAAVVGDSTYCVGDSILLSALGDGISQIEWYSDDTLNTVGPVFNNGYATENDANTTLELEVLLNNQGCVGPPTNVTLLISPSPQALFSVPADTFTSPTTVQFVNNSVGATSYLWQFPDGGESDAFEPEYLFNQVNSAPLTVLIAENDFGCLDTFALNFFMEANAVILNIPNVFTPNGDGCNDFFGVPSSNCGSTTGGQFIQNFKDYTVTIFNRWGQEVIQFGPDGFWDGQDQPDGVYYYVIEATGSDLNTVTRTGSLQLISRK